MKQIQIDQRVSAHWSKSQQVKTPFGVAIMPVIVAALLAIGPLIAFGDAVFVVYIRQTIHGSVLDVAEVASIFGQPWPYVAVALLVLMFCGIVLVNTGFCFSELLIPSRAFFVLLAAILPWAMATSLEIAIGRSRPALYIEHHVPGLRPFDATSDYMSFPSAHAAVSGALAAAFSILAPGYRLTFYFIGFIVCASRLILGRHFPSDVLAGFLIGTLVVVGLVKGFARAGLGLRVM